MLRRPEVHKTKFTQQSSGLVSAYDEGHEELRKPSKTQIEQATGVTEEPPSCAEKEEKEIGPPTDRTPRSSTSLKEKGSHTREDLLNSIHLHQQRIHRALLVV